DYEYGGPPEGVVDEFKWMVDQLHQQGIEVVVDVVYNHTGEGGLWRDKVYMDDTLLDPQAMSDAYYNLDTKEAATIYSMRGLDNQAWYALSADNSGYWNNTGVGNETRPNHAPMRRLIMDSLRFYVEEMHVDGFRFDLAGILGEQDKNYNQWDDPANTVLQEIVDDPVLQKYNTRIIAEPWTAGGSYTSIGAFPKSSTKDSTGWGEWNASFRDWWRAAMNNDSWQLNSQENGIDGGGVITASQARYSWNGRKPYHSVNFVTAHDGFTMYDLLSYNEKQNTCGPLNPICCDDPTSPWCDTQSGEDNNRSRDWGMEAEDFKRQLMRNFFVGMAISHGTPMIYGGDEWMRTQYGNNNAYSTAADNEWNWFRWGEWQARDERWRMYDFVRKI
ncbi:MAG TPA: alpha-amylase family glycosyl hydrolase, partial [Myxococcota bacterium]|nr:alpha-amylase family glycosyl hydrolase [Myxococcota bacterium]